MNTLLRCSVLFLLCGLSVSRALAQTEGALFFPKYGHPEWLAVRSEVSLTPAELVQRHKGALGLSAADEWRRVRSETDALGITHHRYHQYHRGVRVDGAELLVHERAGRVQTLNGKWARGLDVVDVQPLLSAQAALQRALQVMPARRYLWESARAEALLQRIYNNPRATFYPQPQLVLYSTDQSLTPASMRLAWHMEIQMEEPLGRYEVYVDARTGDVLDKTDVLCTQNVPGIAKTRYSGERPIIAERMADQRYRLFETTRGNGIETYNMQRGTSFDAAVDFTDDDNYWDNANAFKDDAATDAHWGAEMTYDYFLHVHDHAGLDDRDFPLISYVHYGSAYDNAFWNGAWATYGDGSGPRNPFTSLDIVGHEFVHGLTQFSAGLRYRNESGALNESFSDIFGAVIRFWARPEKAGWLIGDEISTSAPPFRNMAAPKTQGHPNTYRGQFWFIGTGDNGGVHTNSGVMNYWFYLLTEGGSGVNDNNNAYNVQAIGMEDAAKIAYRNLRYYLTALSVYADARQGALQAAEDLFGVCSKQFLETANAWYAVGVGLPIFPGDMQLARVAQPMPLSCGLTGNEPVVVQVRYWGCDGELPAGYALPMAYQIQGGPVVVDTFVLAASLRYGEAADFTFSTLPAALSQPGIYTLSVWVASGADTYAANDTLTFTLESLPDESDVRLLESQWPAYECFLGKEQLRVRIGYFGCELLPAGTPLTVGYRFVDEAEAFEESIQTPKALQTGETFVHVFSRPVNLSIPARYRYNVWVNSEADVLTDNDTLSGLQIAHIPARTRADVLTFETGAASLDSLSLQPGARSQISLSTQAARTGALGLRITGGDFHTERLQGKAVAPRLETVWNVNPQFRSRVCLCADLTGLASAELRFDLRQSFSFYYLRVLGQHAQFGSAMRILADGTPIGTTFRANTPSADPWRPQTVNLKDLLGRQVELCFETHTGVSADLDTFANSLGDRVLIDNIVIAGQPVVSAPTPENTLGHIRLMPNPATTWAVLAIENAPRDLYWVRLNDPLGRIVHEQRIEMPATATAQVLLPVQALPPGWYSVQVQGSTHQQTLRLLVQRP
ncbi:MAG: M4 family metallopeptidase [Saprospiraceae bacterium]|nr:M4 family metallopeptidase [Saprospiraceae bacterium]MDW8229875.1 M4 family metallopeptidase [Saprospiraceae bacterium]